MNDQFVSEIRLFGGNFAPSGWAFCDGSLLQISSHDALFSLIGTTYGGDGTSNFALPDLRSRVSTHAGSGPGLTPRPLGGKFGVEQVTLDSSQLPNHNHLMQASLNDAEFTTPQGNVTGKTAEGYEFYASPTGETIEPVTLADCVVESTGSGQAHSNMMPSLGLSFIIALVGIYPSRN